MTTFSGTAIGSSPDLDMVREFLSLVSDKEHGQQLHFAPFSSGSFRTFMGADLEAMIAWISDHAPGAQSFYWNLNPVNPDLAVHACVKDVLYRRWMLIDIDRAKDAETLKLSATDAEHEAARTLAEEVNAYLGEQGWPAPILVDSGNGWHLLYRVDLPNDPESRVLLSKVLEKLAEKFDGERGTIGAECFDARRISKLPGTWVRKGPRTEERPWRLARLLHVPDIIEVVTKEQLSALAGSSSTVNGTNSSFTGHAPSGKYGRRALDYECLKMKLAKPGNINNQIRDSGFAMGQLLAAGLLDNEEDVFEKIMAAANVAGANSPHKDADTLRRSIAAGRDNPRKKLPAPSDNWNHTETSHAEELSPPRLQASPVLYSLPDIMRMQIPEPTWTVPGILSEGLTLLAGKPKLGKSFMALNLAITVAAGGKALGNIQTTPGDVLYLSLEDRLRRIQSRARKMLQYIGCEASARLKIAIEWPRQGQGGLAQIKKWLDEVEDPRLVIIDVWQKFRPPSMAGNQYEQDYNHATALKSMLDKRNCSGLGLHHCKKAKGDDVVDEISGTLGLAGAADGLLVLTRTRTENDAELYVDGRDVDRKTIAIEFKPEQFCWIYHGLAAERTEGKVKGALIDLFKANPGMLLGLTEICDRLRIPEEKRDSVRVVLFRMREEGLIDRPCTGKFRWPIQEKTNHGIPE